MILYEQVYVSDVEVCVYNSNNNNKSQRDATNNNR